MASVPSSSSTSLVSPTRRYPPLKIRAAPGAPRISRVAAPRFDSLAPPSAVPPVFPDLGVRRPIETAAEQSRKKNKSDLAYRSKIAQRDIHASMLASTIRELQAIPEYAQDRLIEREKEEAILLQLLAVYEEHFPAALSGAGATPERK